MENQLFGEVRSLLAQQPTVDVFDALVMLLEPLSSIDEALVVYIEGHLARWPDTLQRHVPVWWVHALRRGRKHPAMRFCNTYYYNTSHGTIDANLHDEVVHILPAVRQVHMFEIPMRFDELLDAPSMQSAQHITLFRCDITSFDEITSGAPLPEVHTLNLNSNRLTTLTRGDVEQLVTKYPSLDILNLGGNALGASHPNLERLVSFLDGKIGLAGCELEEQSLLSWPRDHHPARVHLGSNRLTRRALAHILGGEGAGHLRELDLWGALRNEDHATRVDVIAHTRNLDALETLVLGHNRLSPENLSELLGHGHFPSLESLDLSGSTFSSDAFEKFATNASLEHLHELTLKYCRIERGALRPLASARHLESLRGLMLDWSTIQTQEASALMTAPWLKNLERLQLGHCNIDDATCEAIASGVSMERLRELVLESNVIGAEGIRALLDTEWFCLLERLVLSGNRSDPSTVLEFASGNFPNLEQLELDDLKSGYRGIKALTSMQLPSIERLSLARNDIGPLEVKMLIDAPWFGQLESLDLSGNSIEESGLAAITESANHLRTLRLRDTSIPPESWGKIGGSRTLGDLRYLDIGNHRLSPDTLDKIITSETLHPKIIHDFAHQKRQVATL